MISSGALVDQQEMENSGKKDLNGYYAADRVRSGEIAWFLISFESANAISDADLIQ